MDIQQFTEYKQKILGNVTQVIVGKDEAICLLITAYLCRGHVLLEDLPVTHTGVGTNTSHRGTDRNGR